MADITDALEVRYKLVMAHETPWAFCHSLGDYLYYVMSVPQLKSVADQEFQKREREYNEIEALERRSLLEMRKAKKALLAVIESQKIDVTKFTPSPLMLTAPESKHTMIDEMESFETGKISVNGFHSDYLENYLFDIAANISKLGYADQLKEFTVSENEYGKYQSELNGYDSTRVFGGNIRGNFIFSETWPKRFQKIKSVDDARKHETWGAFESLLKFWRARQEVIKNSNPDQIYRNCWDDKDYPFRDGDAADIVEITEELKNINEYHSFPESRLEYIKLDDLRVYISTAHLEFIKAVTKKEDLPKLDLIALSKAIRNKKDRLREQKIDATLDEIKAFMIEYRHDRLDREIKQQKEIGGKWWKPGSQPSYDKMSRKIKLDGRECEIPPKAFNQQIICEALFPPRRFLGEQLPEYEVIHLFYKRKGKDASPRAFYDAVDEINTKIEANLKVIKMLKYQDSPCQVRIRKELFI